MVNIYEQPAIIPRPGRKYYAGIGSRHTPETVCAQMTQIASVLETNEYVLRSGGADRADKAFEAGVRSPANKEIFDPRHGHLEISEGAIALVKELHPNPEAAMKYIQFLGRSAYQVLGVNLDKPVDFVICWSIKGQLIGGTAMGMRIALKYNIPVYNMYRTGTRQVLLAVSDRFGIPITNF